MDWTGCNLVEVIPGKSSGRPLIIGTRIPAEAILSNFAAGSSIDEIAENYPSAPVHVIQQLLSFASCESLRTA